MRLWIVFAVLLYLSAAVRAQETVRTVNYSTTNGMLSDVTYSGIFDRNNYLWICTDRGLSRFDGTDFTHFTISEGLPDNDVIYVTEDGAGNIWAQPFQRETAFLAPNKSVFTNINTIIPPDTVSKDVSYRVFRLRDGAAGLLSQNGVVRIIQWGKWVRSCRLPFETTAWNIFLYEDAKHRLIAVKTGSTWIIGPDGSTHREANELSFMRYEVFGNKVVLQQRDDRVLTVFNLLDESVTRVDPGIAVSRFGFFKKGVLAGDLMHRIAYTDFSTGETKMDSLKAFVSYAAENAPGSVQVIFSADEGIFVRTFDQQFKYTYLNKTPYHFYLEDGELQVADGQGRVIFPGRKNLRMQTNKGTTIPVFAESFGKTDIVYSSNLMLFSSGKYTGKIDRGGIKDIYLLNDSIRYLSTFAGVFMFNKNNGDYRRLYEGRTTCTGAGPDGSVFIGTHWGLLELKKDGTVYDWTKSNDFPAVRVVDISCRGEVVWLATAGKGLIAIYGGRVKTVLTDQNGTSRNFITAIEEDAGRNLYIGYYDGAEKISYAVRHGFPVIWQRVILKTYKGEGVKSFFRWKGKLYALGNRGVFTFDGRPEPLREFSLRITRIMINNGLSEVAGRYSLQPGDYDFLISFSSINFEQFPLRYRYRVNGGAWNYTSDDEIRYKNLSWGTYTITIQVLNNYCKPSDTKTIVFDVHPPFFRRPGFLVAAGIVLAILVVLLARGWFLKKYRKEKELLIHENKLNELELVALKAQINPHFVFNCLNSIKGLIYENELEEADKYIDRFAQLFRNTLEASSSAFHTVSTEIAYLKTYLEIEQVSVKGRFGFSIDAGQEVLELNIPTMLLQPYVENAVKHGMSGLRDRKGEIRIAFRLEAGRLVCTVSDNGAGIGSGPGTRAHSGKGIPITSRRAQLYGIETAISGNIPSGTVVRIMVPSGIINTIQG